MINNLRELPIADRIRLVEDIWDSIAAEQELLALTDEQKEELNRRLDAYEADGIKGKPATDVLADIRKRL